jgi:hypothetical protein
LLWRWRPLLAAIVVLWSTGLAVGSLHPLGALAALAALAAAVRAGLALGAYGAVRSADQSSRSSYLMTAYLVLTLASPLPCMLLRRAEPALLMASSPPYLTMLALLSRDEVGAAFGARAFDGAQTLGVAGMPGGALWLLATALVGPLLLTLGAAWLDRASERAWDAAVGRPVRGTPKVRGSPVRTGEAALAR